MFSLLPCSEAAETAATKIARQQEVEAWGLARVGELDQAQILLSKALETLKAEAAGQERALESIEESQVLVDSLRCPTGELPSSGSRSASCNEERYAAYLELFERRRSNGTPQGQAVATLLLLRSHQFDPFRDNSAVGEGEVARYRAQDLARIALENLDRSEEDLESELGWEFPAPDLRLVAAAVHSKAFFNDGLYRQAEVAAETDYEDGMKREASPLLLIDLEHNLALARWYSQSPSESRALQSDVTTRLEKFWDKHRAAARWQGSNPDRSETVVHHEMTHWMVGYRLAQVDERLTDSTTELGSANL